MHINKDYQIFLYFDQNNEFHYGDYSWPPIIPIKGDFELVSTAEYLLNIIKDIVEKDGYVKIRRLEVYKRSFSKLKGANNLDKYLILLHQSGYIYFNYRPKGNKKWYVVLNPYQANRFINLHWLIKLIKHFNE